VLDADRQDKSTHDVPVQLHQDAHVAALMKEAHHASLKSFAFLVFDGMRLGQLVERHTDEQHRDRDGPLQHQ
jgi:hypothetical protein